MIKLVRNTLSDLAVLRNSSGDLIKWEFIEALYHVQVRGYPSQSDLMWAMFAELIGIKI
jgi:hypothetical protein